MSAAMEDKQNATNKIIHIVLQSPTGSRELTVGADCTAKQLKAGLAERMAVPKENLVLIHCGRVLEEAEMVSSLQGKDASVEIYAIQRPSVSNSPTLQTAARTPTSPLFLVEGLSDSGPGLFPTLQSQMESQLLSDPQMMRRVLDSPLVQSTLSTASPELTRQLILSNPQIQQLLQTNPELEEALYNSDVMTQVLELVRNPDMIMEVLKSEESGNFRQDSPESTNQHFTFPPRISNNKQKNGDSSPPQNGCTDSKLAASVKAGISPQSTISASMQTLLEQITSSPGLMENLLSGPYVSSLLQCLSHNPELAAQMLLNHPVLSENPHLQQHMRQHLPLLLQQMQNPELLSAMLNPKAVEALLQIQQGLQTLAKEAPALVPPTVFGNSGANSNAPDAAHNNKTRNASQAAMGTEQQQQFVQQMLQALANSDCKDLDQLTSAAFEDR